MLIVLCGGKGGTGKSTVATNLAAMRAASGRDVLLVNTDPTGIAASWAERREEAGIKPSLACINLFGKTVAAELRKQLPRFDDVIVDCAGADSNEQRQAMLVADKLIIPSQPSQFDIDALSQVDVTVGHAKSFNDVPALVVTNGASTHPASTDQQDVADAISGMVNLTMAASVVRYRLSFKRAAAEGRAVHEYQPVDQKAADEMAALYAEVFGEKP